MDKNELLEYGNKKESSVYKLFNGLSFDEEQYGVIERGLVGRFTSEQMDYLMHPELPAYQLDEVRLAIKSGISNTEQLDMLLTPGLRAWQLDILRQGYENEIDMDKTAEIAKIGAPESDISAIDRDSHKWGELKQQMMVLVRKEHNHEVRSLRMMLNEKVGESMAKIPSDCPVQSYKESIGLTI